MQIRQMLKNVFYGIFGLLSKVKTVFFSNFFIATGYFIRNIAEFKQSPAIEYKEDRFKFHQFLSTQLVDPGEKIHYFEFGVRWGQIIKIWANNNQHKETAFAGFDTFTGLPEDWGSVKKGSYSNNGEIPQTDDTRIRFCVGLVQDTLPVYLQNMDSSTKIIAHFDFDLYSATLFSLIQLAAFFKKGDLLIFDEYFSISKNHHEYRAFHDFLSVFPLKYKPLYKCRAGQYIIELI